MDDLATKLVTAAREGILAAVRDGRLDLPVNPEDITDPKSDGESAESILFLGNDMFAIQVTPIRRPSPISWV